MSTFKFIFTVGLSFFLLVIPEPITTFLGVALLGWSILHFLGWPGKVTGACRCDYCRLGHPKASHHSNTQGWSVASALVSSYPANFDRLDRIRRAQATLPLTQGRGHTRLYRNTESYTKGGW